MKTAFTSHSTRRNHRKRWRKCLEKIQTSAQFRLVLAALPGFLLTAVGKESLHLFVVLGLRRLELLLEEAAVRVPC